MNIRRSIYYVLLTVAVLAPILLAGRYFVKALNAAGWVSGVPFLSLFVAITLLCIWCAIFVREEPRLVRIVLIWIALLSIWIPIAVMTLPAAP
jgi:hypothetical protein